LQGGCGNDISAEQIPFLSARRPSESRRQLSLEEIGVCSATDRSNSQPASLNVTALVELLKYAVPVVQSF